MKSIDWKWLYIYLLLFGVAPIRTHKHASSWNVLGQSSPIPQIGWVACLPTQIQSIEPTVPQDPPSCPFCVAPLEPPTPQATA